MGHIPIIALLIAGECGWRTTGKVEVTSQYKCQTGLAYQKAHHYSIINIEKGTGDKLRLVAIIHKGGAHWVHPPSAKSAITQGKPNYYGVLDLLLYKALEEFPIYKRDVVVLGSQRYIPS